MKLKSKIILFILMITLLLNLKPNTASAAHLHEKSYMMLVTTTTALRNIDNFPSSLSASIPANRTIICKSDISNNFIRAEFCGLTGYVSANDLKPVHSNISFRKVTINNLCLKDGPDSYDDTIMTIPQNEIVLYWGNATSDAAEVYYNGKIGWVSRKFLSTLKAGDTSLNPSTQFKDNWRLVNTTSLELRFKPSTNSPIRATIPQYEKVEYLGEKSGTSPNVFAKVKYYGETGWVLAKHLSTFNRFQVSDNTRLVLTNLNLRNGPANSYNAKLTIPKGSVVTYSGKKQNGFAEVSYKGTTGWVLASSLSKFNYANTYVSYYSIHLDNSDDNQIHNLDLASKKLSQTIIMPGESFSVLNILGDCTEKNGYKGDKITDPFYLIDGKETLGYAGYVDYHSSVSRISRLIFATMLELDIYAFSDFHDTKFVNTLDKPIMLTFISENGNAGFMVSILEAK